MDDLLAEFTTHQILLVAVLGGLSLALFVGLILFARRGPREILADRTKRLLDAPRLRSSKKADILHSQESTPAMWIRDARQHAPETAQPARSKGALWVDGVLYRIGFQRRNLKHLGLAVGGGLAAMIALFVAGAEPVGAILLGLVFSLGLPLFLVLRARRQRLEVIESEFPVAIDIMTRGLRAGLPMPDCLQLVARETDPALAQEFRQMVNEIDIGLSVAEATRRFALRLPLPEVQLFAIVIGIQSVTGGAIASSLEAVGRTVRSRRMLREKISIMSNEARASAAIIGALPVVLGIVLFVVSPDYIGMMFSSTTGQLALLGAAIWMFAGVQVMRSMINFDA